MGTNPHSGLNPGVLTLLRAGRCEGGWQYPTLRELRQFSSRRNCVCSVLSVAMSHETTRKKTIQAQLIFAQTNVNLQTDKIITCYTPIVGNNRYVSVPCDNIGSEACMNNDYKLDWLL